MIPAFPAANGTSGSAPGDVGGEQQIGGISLVRRHPWGAALLVCLGYYLGSKLGFILTFRPHPVSVLWPPNSILLTALLLAPVRYWLFLLLAALPAHLISQWQGNVPLPMMLCYFISNCCEALIGAAAFRYFVGGPARFDNARCVVLFCLLGGFLGPFVSCFIDAGFVRLNHWGTGTFWEIWRIRLFSNVLTALTLVPAIVTWCTRRNVPVERTNRRQYLEIALLSGGLIAVSIAVLYSQPLTGHPALFYLPLPFLLWATLRFGARGIATAIVAISLLAIWSAAHGHGPFIGGSPEENARAIQLFLIAMTIPFLFLGAVVEEWGIAEERFGKAFRANPDAMWITRLRDGMLLDVNEQWETLFGYRRAEVVGLTTHDVKLWNDPADRAELVSNVKHAPVRELEVSLRNKAGAILPVLLSADLVEMSGEHSLIVIIRDLRDRKRAEEAARDLVHASRLAAVGELTASLAHELNQPLTAIASNAAAGRRFLEHGSQDQDLFRELLVDVGSDARRASDIIQGIRHLVQKGEGPRRLVDLNQVVRDVLRLLHSDILGRGASAATDLDPSLPPVAADPVHLQQVVLNLLLNSLDAMEATPAERRSLHISTTIEPDSFVCVSVRDHGVGLPTDNPEKVFEHFYSTKPNGMGMGLTIVRSIVEAHGGQLSVENTGDGARFYFRLPIAIVSAQEAVA